MTALFNIQNCGIINAKKIITRTGKLFICLVDNKNEKTFFFYMCPDGKRFISKGELKSSDCLPTPNEWGWAKNWEGAKKENLSEQEFELAINLAKKIIQNQFYGFTEDQREEWRTGLQKKTSELIDERNALAEKFNNKK